MSENCDVIVIFPISGQFRAIQEPDPGRLVCKTYIILQKLKTEVKHFQHSAHTIALSKVTIVFLPKNADFLQKKNADVSNILRAFVLKGIFTDTACVYVLTYQISSF